MGGVGRCECGAHGTCVIWHVHVACGVYMCGVSVTGMGRACVCCGCRQRQLTVAEPPCSDRDKCDML